MMTTAYMLKPPSYNARLTEVGRGTPKQIIERLQREMRFALAEQAVADKLIAQGQTPVGSTPEELAKVLSQETPIWADLVRQSGAKVD